MFLPAESPGKSYPKLHRRPLPAQLRNATASAILPSTDQRKRAKPGQSVLDCRDGAHAPSRAPTQSPAAAAKMRCCPANVAKEQFWAKIVPQLQAMDIHSHRYAPSRLPPE